MYILWWYYHRKLLRKKNVEKNQFSPSQRNITNQSKLQ